MLNALKRRLPSLMQHHNVPGVQCSLCVGERAMQSLALGLADTAQQRPLTVDTKFLMASLTKPFSALVILELASRGELQLDQPIGTMVDSAWADSMHEGLSSTTIRQLLMHTAGVPYRDSEMFVVEEVNSIADHPLAFDTTTRAQFLEHIPVPEHSRTYTSRSYIILQRIVERLMGTPFAEIARTRSIAASAARLDFSIESACDPAIARDHDQHGNVLPQQWTASVAASGLVGTSADLVGAMKCALQQRDRLHINELFQRPRGIRCPYTCGLHLRKDRDQRILDHGAARPGMRGVIKVVPDANIIMVILTNGRKGVDVFRSLVGLLEELGLARLSLGAR